MPRLLAVTVTMKAGALDALDAHAIAEALGGICQAHALMPAEVWAARTRPDWVLPGVCRREHAAFRGAHR